MFSALQATVYHHSAPKSVKTHERMEGATAGGLCILDALLTLLISSVALQGLAGKRRSVGNRPAPTHRAGQAPGRTSAELRSRPFSAERQLRV